jgi:hypothetical protein
MDRAGKEGHSWTRISYFNRHRDHPDDAQYIRPNVATKSRKAGTLGFNRATARF